MSTTTTVPPSAGDGVVIAGGGLAGQRCAEALRRLGYGEKIRLVCAEQHRPYDRPPLSKDLLIAPEMPPTPAFRDESWYETASVDLILGVGAAALRPAERRLVLSDGTELRYGRLLIATGSRPRPLDGWDGYLNVSLLRTVEDARVLRAVLRRAPRLAIIGAGFIGQEVASAARRLGATVTMIEAAPAPLDRVLGPQLGRWFTRLHRSEGVTVKTGCTVSSAHGSGNVRRLTLSDGSRVQTDHVVLGVGALPNTEWLAGCGLQYANGVPTDPHGRTAVEGVLAAGDAAASFDRVLGAHVPGSHWEAAGFEGARAARVMLGLDPGPAPVTSFWTDQYEVRIQYLGHARVADAVAFDGDLSSRDFTAVFSRGGRPVGVLLVGRPRWLPRARQLLEKGTNDAVHGGNR